MQSKTPNTYSYKIKKLFIPQVTAPGSGIKNHFLCIGYDLTGLIECFTAILE